MKTSYPNSWLLFGMTLLLMALLGTTLMATRLPLGRWHFATGLSIAAAKMGIIAIVFMNLRRSASVIRLVAVAVFMWLLILVGLVLIDWQTRTVIDVLTSVASR